MSRVLLFLVLALISSCQEASKEPGSAQVRLRFPQTLKEPGARWERFLARVIQLEITVSNGSAERRIAAGPLAWKNLSLDDWEPPAGDASIEIKAKVWDRNAQGIPRSYPVVVGQTKIKASDWVPGQEIPLRMSLQVSVKEYD